MHFISRALPASGLISFLSFLALPPLTTAMLTADAGPVLICTMDRLTAASSCEPLESESGCEEDDELMPEEDGRLQKPEEDVSGVGCFGFWILRGGTLNREDRRV